MVRGVAAGSTTAYALGDVPDPGVQACGCPLYHEVQLNAPVQVSNCPNTASTSLTDPLNETLVYPTLLTGTGNVARVAVAPSGANWDGLNIIEAVSGPVTNTCPATFPHACSGNSTFTIAEGYQPVVTENNVLVPVGPLLVGTHNEFFDQYTATSVFSLLDVSGGGSSCAQTCSQQYTNACGQQILTHTFTMTFTKSTINGTNVTLVSVTD